MKPVCGLLVVVLTLGFLSVSCKFLEALLSDRWEGFRAATEYLMEWGVGVVVILAVVAAVAMGYRYFTGI